MVSFGLDVATEDEWSEPELLIDLAVEADSAGWDGFFLWDILQSGDPATPIAEPWTVLTAIAIRTSRIRIGAMVTPLPRLQPWEVARRVTALDRLSGGRVIFGAGIGWKATEFEQVGMSGEASVRAEQLEEGLDLLRELWTGEPVTFAGRHYQVAGVQLRPVPLQRPRPPVWLAAGWPRRAPLGRAIGWDGVCLMTNNQATDERLSPDDVRAVAAVVAGHRSDGSFAIAANLSTVDDADGGTAAAQALAEAGATWLIELTPRTVEDHRRLIRRGPPAL